MHADRTIGNVKRYVLGPWLLVAAKRDHRFMLRTRHEGIALGSQGRCAMAHRLCRLGGGDAR